MAYFKYNNKNIFYEEKGKGETLIFLHGNTASSKMFDLIIDYYTDKYQVITIDFLGHGKSDRLEKFPVNLWHDEAIQTIALIDHLSLKNVNLLGTSGGAFAAINVALERPDLVNKVIADSFDGRTLGDGFYERLSKERKESKNNEQAIQFYRHCHGEDWEKIVDQDTECLLKLAKDNIRIFNKKISELKLQILLTASYEDEMIRKDFEQEYLSIAKEMLNSEVHFFQAGFHPAVISNNIEFSEIVKKFLN